MFKSSTGLVGKIWSQCSVGLLDSNIQLSLLHIQPHNNGEANTSFGGGVELNGTCYKKTPGVYLKNSTLTLGGKSYRWPSMIRDDSDYGKMYISKDSKVIVYGSLHLGPGSSVCFPDAGNTKYVTSTKGGYRLENGDNGSAVVAFSGSSGYQRLYFYDKNDNWTCMPYNQGICTDYNKYKRSYVLGHVSATGHYGNWSGVDPNNWNRVGAVNCYSRHVTICRHAVWDIIISVLPGAGKESRIYMFFPRPYRKSGMNSKSADKKF